jgi:hypothetical protein
MLKLVVYNVCLRRLKMATALHVYTLTAASLGSFFKGQTIYGKGFASDVRQELCVLYVVDTWDGKFDQKRLKVWESRQKRVRAGSRNSQRRRQGYAMWTTIFDVQPNALRTVCATWVHRY